MRRPMLAVAVLATACGSSSPKPALAPAPAPASAAAAATLPAPSVANQVQYYDIEGSSLAELREQIRRLGPKSGAESEDAQTIWDLEWTYDAAPGPGGCVMRNVRVTLTLTVTLPRWAPPRDVPAAVLQGWQTYLQHLKLHESGHQAIAQRNARDLMAALMGMRATGCDELSRQASQTGERIVAEGRAKNRQYDVDTKHGQTQGVVLQP
jgi:predicted secreted Zn-dependent protease